MRLTNMSILLVVLGFMPVKTYAQNKDVQMFELGFGAGLTTPIGSYHDGAAQTSAALGLNEAVVRP